MKKITPLEELVKKGNKLWKGGYHKSGGDGTIYEYVGLVPGTSGIVILKKTDEKRGTIEVYEELNLWLTMYYKKE